MKPAITDYYYRTKISEAQVFINSNILKSLTLDSIAKEVGISPFHFIRLFRTYSGETPFEFLRRKKILLSLELLAQTQKNITEIALNSGFESSSSFNKVFKKKLGLSPREFRNLGKEKQLETTYSLNMSPKTKEVSMNLNMTEKPEIVSRPETKIYSKRISGKNFSEIAPLVWDDFIKVLTHTDQDLSESEWLGLSYIDQKEIEENSHIYKAAISVPSKKEIHFSEFEHESISPQKYLKFVLKGSYLGIWAAFEKAFEIMDKNGHILGDGPCLENYINDPKETPEEELLTEILIPVKS